MPLVRVAKVLRCSSEDPVFSSQNLLLTEKFRKFVGNQSTQGQRIEVDLQLAASTQITGIDLGNHGSAFINIMVSNMDNERKDFVTLLPETMLQSPADARAGRHKNSVRMFQSFSLSPSSRDHTWDVVRIILRQPYRPREQFGLAFLKLQGKSTSTSASVSSPSASPLATSPARGEKLAHVGGNIGGLVQVSHSPPSSSTTSSKLTPVSNKSHQKNEQVRKSSHVRSVSRSLLPGSSTHQLPTSAGSIMAKAPQRLVMSRVRRRNADLDDASPNSKRWCSGEDGVALRSDIAKYEALAKEKTTNSSKKKGILTPTLSQLRSKISAEKARSKEEEEDVWAKLSGGNVLGDMLMTHDKAETLRRKSDSLALPRSATSPSSTVQASCSRVDATTPSCSTRSSNSSDACGHSVRGEDFIEFGPATPQRQPSSQRPSRSILDQIDSELNSMGNQRPSSMIFEDCDGMTPRRSFLDPRNKERTPRGLASVDFMNSYSKQKPKLPENVTPTVLGLGGAEEAVDKNGVRLEQRVDENGRVTYKKIERRPIPKPLVTLQTRWKLNKQMKIGTMLSRMRGSTDAAAAADGSSGWLQTGDVTEPTTERSGNRTSSVSEDPLHPATPHFAANSHVVPVTGDLLELEILGFLHGIDLASLDLETVTFRDMREQFEFGRGEELEKGQHRKFLTLAREVVEKATASDDVQIIEHPVANGATSYSPAAAATVQCPLCQL